MPIPPAQLGATAQAFLRPDLRPPSMSAPLTQPIPPTSPTSPATSTSSEADLSGFDVPVRDPFEWEDSSEEFDPNLGYAATPSVWSPTDSVRQTGRGGTEVMNPLESPNASAYAQASGAAVFSSDHVATPSGIGAKIALGVGIFLVLCSIIYFVQFNPYFFENIVFRMTTWMQTQGMALLTNVATFFHDVILQIANTIR